MDPPVPPSLEDSFHKSSHKDWKQLLRCVLDSDLPFPESPRISGVLDYFRTENLRHRDLGDYLSKLFQNLCQVASGAQPDPNNALIPAAFVLCLHLIDVKPEAIIRPESLLHERLPRFHIKEFEPLIAPLLTRLMFFKLNLGPDSVKFHPEGSEKPGVTFLTVLIDLAQTILVDSLPIPVTETSVDCVMNLLVMNPAITEKYIGSFAAVILFNMDSVMTQGFSRLLMGTYHRMRQVPKLISRMLQAVGGNPSKIKVCELDTVFMEDFAECVIQLPLLKISELWKTLLFHVNRDIVLAYKPNMPEMPNRRACRNVASLVNQIGTVFFNSICVIDHKVPATDIEKISDLCRVTMEDVYAAMAGKALTWLDDSQYALRDLMLTLMQNRGCDFTDVLNNEDIAMETANTIGQDLKAALVLNKPIPPMPLPAFDNLQYLPQMLPYLTFEQLFDHVDLYLTSPEHRAKLLQMRELVEEDQRVQTCILLHLLSAFQREYLSTTEKILRPVGASKWAFEDLESEDAKAALLKGFSVFRKNSIGYVTDETLEADKFFATPLEILEALPLEAIHPTLNNLASLMTVTLMLVCAKEPVNSRLYVVLARCVDPVFRNSEILKLINGAMLLSWIARLRFYDEITEVEAPARIISQSVVKFIGEYSDKFGDDFHLYLDKLRSYVNSFMVDKGVLVSIIFLEALERPLVFRDASAEKIALCDAHFQMYSEGMLKGLSGFTEAGKLSDYARELAVRALTSAITIVQSHPKAGELWPNWKPHISTIYAYVHSKPLNEPLNKIDKRFLVVVLKNHRILEDCLSGDFVQEVWRKVAANYQKEDALEAGEDEGDTNELLSLLFRCMDTNQMKTALDNIINSIVSGAEFAQTLDIWNCLVKCDKLSKELQTVRKEALEELVPLVQIKVSSKEANLIQDIIPLLQLEHSLLDTEKPLISRESEGGCVRTALLLNLEQLATDPNLDFQTFLQLWKLIYDLLFVGFVRRANSVIIPRIPNVQSILRNLIKSLLRAGDQRRKVEASELHDLVMCGHHFDRLTEQIRKQKEDFARVAPFLISDVLVGFQHGTLYPAIKTNILSGTYKLLDICDKHSKEHLAGTLPDGTREIFKQVLENYNQYHKYTGKV